MAGPTTRRASREGEEIRIPVREEQVNVSKDAVVTEEVKVGKRVVQDTEHVSGAGPQGRGQGRAEGRRGRPHPRPPQGLRRTDAAGDGAGERAVFAPTIPAAVSLRDRPWAAMNLESENQS